jgi:hypothetical protein
MNTKWCALLILYVVLDFSNPHMPGAVNFDADECVEGVGAPGVRQGELLPIVLEVKSVSGCIDESRTIHGRGAEMSLRPALAGWLLDLRRANAPARPPASSPTEDG